MLFEELIEQHRVYCVVAHGVWFSFPVDRYQGRIYLCYFLSNQTSLWRIGLVVLVVEGHWLKRKDRFTALVHGIDVLLEPHRGDIGTKLAGGWVNLYGGTEGTIAVDSADETCRVRESGGRPVADGNNVAFARSTCIADVDIAAASGLV